MEKPTFRSIQALRGVAAVQVVVYHLALLERLHVEPGKQWIPDIAAYAYSGVDLFFIISGFVMMTATRGVVRSPLGAREFLLRRAARVLPLYWLYTSLLVLPMLILPGVLRASYGWEAVVASYLLWPQAHLPILNVGWTLIYEAYFYLVVAACLAFFNERRTLPLLTIWGVMVLTSHVAFDAQTLSPWMQTMSNPLVLEFAAGAYVAHFWTRIPPRYGPGIFLAGCVVVIASLCMASQLSITSPSPVLRVVLFGFPAVILVLGAVMTEAGSHWRPHGWLLAVGNASYSIYLSHPFVLSLAGRTYQHAALAQGALVHVGLLLASLGACVGVGLVSCRYVELPLLYRCRALLHRRSP